VILRAVGVLLVIWTALAWIRFCLGELGKYPPTLLPREAWAFLIIVTVPLGGLAYMLLERGWRPR
jgi:hypothetical protein